MTADELRAKFEAYRKLLEARGFRWSETEWNSRFDTWQAAHDSRDAEVEALIRKYEKKSMYEDGGFYSNIIDDLQELLGK